MSAEKPSQRVTYKKQIIEWFSKYSKPKAQRRIGTEHEKFLFYTDSLRPVAYEGESGIGEMLNRLAARHNMQPITEHGHIIGLKTTDGGSVTLEPGGQLELSGAPLETLHETCAETGRHLKQMRDITAEMGLGMLGVGFQPIWGRDDISWMPKGRYRIMRRYMPTRGQLGLDMMLRSCTVQVNLDYADEADMVKKFRTSLALQPVATALFANSPFKDGAPSGLKSTRALVWTDTDPDRCGVPGCVFEPDFSFERWVDYILDVPMYFLHRGDDYLDVSGLSFRDFMAGELKGFEGEYPTIDDFADHVTTAFPEVRLKGYLEMRGADGGSWDNICALPAFWVGLLYDEQALDEAAVLAGDITAKDVEAARLDVAKNGLAAALGRHDMLSLARRTLEIAKGGLRRRARTDPAGNDETGFLAPLNHIAASAQTNADLMLTRYDGDWQGDIKRIFSDYHY